MILCGTRWLSLGLLVGLCGCHALMDHYDEKTMALRDHCAAERAWWSLRPIYVGMVHRGDFKQGFKDGYISVAQGGTGCRPPMAPRRYWGAEHQGPVGHGQQIAWFDGFAHGAATAQMHGVATWNKLVVSPNVLQAHQMQAARHHVVPFPTDAVPAVVPPAPVEDPMDGLPFLPPPPNGHGDDRHDSDDDEPDALNDGFDDGFPAFPAVR